MFPNTWLNVLLAFLFAAFFGVGAAVLTDVLDNTIRDPDQVARWLNTDVIGSLPAVKDWRRRLSPIHHSNGPRRENRAVERHRAGACERRQIGAAVKDATDQALSNYEEAIRTLRNSILLTDFDRRLRSVLLTSASPSEGKSTVAAHLAATHAGQHKRTLLIDGDLRRPSVHRLFQVPNTMGLSNVLMKQISWLDAVVVMDEPNGLRHPAGRSVDAPGLGSDRHGPGGADRRSHPRIRPGGARRPPAAGFRRALANGHGGRRSDRRSPSRRHQPQSFELGDHDPSKAAGEFSGGGVE